jgi:TRAP-type uncharacterized transport system fused permease subunit
VIWFKQIVDEWLRRDYLVLLTVFIVIWILLVGWSSYHHGFWKGWLILITIPAGVLVLEILLRAVMRITYGKNYVYSILNFTLVDHEKFKIE